jgi:hypothetical protein
MTNLATFPEIAGELRLRIYVNYLIKRKKT